MSETVLNLRNLSVSDLDDLIFFTLVIFCIAIGKYYRKIICNAKKEIFGNILGVLIVIITSRSNALHIFCCFAICAGIILLHKKLPCHIFVCTIMFFYLWIFRKTTIYLGLTAPSSHRHTNMIQMILALKLVGLAFEVKDVTLKCRKASKEEYEQIPYHEKELAEITLRNIFGYCFNYVSVITGPYLTYRTYRDSIVEKYSSDEKLTETSNRIILEKFKTILILGIFRVLANYFWPLERIFEDEFYTDKTFIYRLWYIWPASFFFRVRVNVVLIFSECIFSAAGVGAYPTIFQSSPGRGPRTKDSQLLEVWDGIYDFNTTRNSYIYTTETCLSFREFWRNWNRCVQYWMAMNVYKRFHNRRYQEGLTFLVSAYWHGVSSGYYFSIAMSALYLPIEDLCLKRLKSAFPNFPTWLKVCLWINKLFAFSYMIIAFQLLSFPRVWKYYNSVYHFGYIVFACQYILAYFWPNIATMVLGKKKPKSNAEIKENQENTKLDGFKKD